LSENLLQVTRRVVVLADEGRRTTKEGVGAGGDDYAFGFALFARRAAVELISDERRK
jgi:hypothetical protein